MTTRTSAVLRIPSLGLSYLLHPLLMPVYGFLFLSSLDYHGATRIAGLRYSLLLLIGITTFGIPVMLVSVMKTLGFIKSLHMFERKERTVPFLLTALVYYFAYRFFRRTGIPIELQMMILGATAMILIAMLVNLKFKISIHMMGVGGMTGMLHGLAFWFPHQFFIPIVVIVGFAGLLGCARLILGSHRQSEIYSGYLVGYILFYVLFSSLAG